MYYAVVPVAGVDGQLSLIVPHIVAWYRRKKILGGYIQIFNADLEFNVSSIDWRELATYLAADLGEVKKVYT